jgi:putative heme-binding domain-containing protein
MRPRAAVLLLVVGGLTPPARLAAQPKLLPPNLVAPTDALSPADERKAFAVPAGFEVQLVAAEPDIQKPMQMAWDAKGRLWVTTSHHYPFAAEPGKATDKLFVLSDFDPATGKARKVQTFAGDLNIPIGVLPLPDCKSVIVSSVGEIRKYADADGDGEADGPPEVLFTGFGSADTHGMTNSFTLMPDGWVYACHGFRNESAVKGKDGHEVQMQSGHTFRFRPDGSRIEVHTRGQVNPFGMAVDPWFNLYTADCHSKPVTQLIPGAVYESFGKPHDGLGFAPHVTKHDHGSTGLCGVAWYDADHFPKEYRGCVFVGNVVTNRINFDRIEWKGATPVAKELPDFLTSTDRWFRPVDLKLGPDGALYVADFYNKIVGHYEVDLKHPGRDKDRGRLWRVVWKGTDDKAAPPRAPGAPAATPARELLTHPNLSVRLQAVLAYQHGVKPVPEAGPWPQFPAPLSVWLGAPADDALAAALVPPKGGYPLNVGGSPEPLAAVRAVRVAAARKALTPGLRAALAAALGDHPRVARAAAEAAVAHPHADFVPPLVELLRKLPADDTHLRHAARIALRNCLRDADAWPPFHDALKAREGFDPAYADIALGIRSEKAAAYLLSQIRAAKLLPDQLAAAAEHVARHAAWKNDDEEALFRSLRLYSPVGAGAGPEAVFAALKGVQARGAQLGEPAAKFLFGAAERAVWGSDAFTMTPYPGDAGRKEFLWGARMLNALPAVTDAKDVRLSGSALHALSQALDHRQSHPEMRLAAVEALVLYAPADGLEAVRRQADNPATPEALRTGFLLALARSANADARRTARDALKDAPYRLAVAVAAALAGSPDGAEDLMSALRLGKAPARLLQEKVILERLRAAKVAELDKQVAALTKGLPPPDARLADLIKKRAAAFASAKPDVEQGAKLFTKHCAACHRIADQGGKIAPQLDGIGVRGLERLLEDTLDPNRNVDQAFRARVITTKDEKTVTGLMLRVEGEVVVVADAEGKEVRVPAADVAANRETMLSPMPANFADVIPEAEFAHLLAYLLSQRAK